MPTRMQRGIGAYKSAEIRILAGILGTCMVRLHVVVLVNSFGALQTKGMHQKIKKRTRAVLHTLCEPWNEA